MKTTALSVRTGSDPGLFDLTSACASFVAGEGDGLLNVFVPHATDEAHAEVRSNNPDRKSVV